MFFPPFSRCKAHQCHVQASKQLLGALKCTPKWVLLSGKANVLLKTELDEFTDSRSQVGTQGLGRTRPSLVPGRSGCVQALQVPPRHHLHHTPGLEGPLIWSQISNKDRNFFRNALTKGATSLPRLALFVLAPSSHPAPAQDAATIQCPLPTFIHLKCFSFGRLKLFKLQ